MITFQGLPAIIGGGMGRHTPHCAPPWSSPWGRTGSHPATPWSVRKEGEAWARVPNTTSLGTIKAPNKHKSEQGLGRGKFWGVVGGPPLVLPLGALLHPPGHPLVGVGKGWGVGSFLGRSTLMMIIIMTLDLVLVVFGDKSTQYHLQRVSPEPFKKY